jgi:chorismate mutase
MKSINIQKIRKKLDKIDIKLLNIIKERSALVDKVVKLKKFKKEIIDKKRINFILKRIKKKSIIAKIDPMITVSIWKEMIKAFIRYEYKNFKKK